VRKAERRNKLKKASVLQSHV